MAKKALVLAAGLGTRLSPHTKTLPKPLFPLGGKTILDRVVLGLKEAGCDEIVINTHHLHRAVEAHVASMDYGLLVTTSHEPEILGTGGAMANLAHVWGEDPFFAVNADILFNLDLSSVWDHHIKTAAGATLVLLDDPRFNTVWVQNGQVLGFDAENPGHAKARYLTFSGIQVLSPKILEFIPPKGFYSSIDAFRQMLSAGIPIAAYLPPENSVWMDLGTPERYGFAAAMENSRQAFFSAFGSLPPGYPEMIRLKGDGSDRAWFRARFRGKSLICADHGMGEKPRPHEMDAFFHIGRHLESRGLPVPRIHLADRFSGQIWLEDLGDVHLQTRIQAAPDKEKEEIYEQIISLAFDMWEKGARGFDPSWTWQTPAYDARLILEYECRYFVEAFLGPVANLPVSFEALEGPFRHLAEKIKKLGYPGFLHRDLQSRNIMVKNGRFYFIDFAGGRAGPIQYDLAALFIDPYVDLPPGLQDRLLETAVQTAETRFGLSPARFRDGYAWCALSRNLQMLGAFGFLWKKKGKSQFAAHIPPAFNGLKTRLAGFKDPELAPLRDVCQKAELAL